MSDLNPKGIPITIDGVERRFLFTLNVIDDIQDHFETSLSEVVQKFTEKGQAYKTLRYVVMALLNDEAERELAAGHEGYNLLTEQETGWLITLENEGEIALAVLKAYGYSLPEGDEDPNQESGTTQE